MEVKKARLDYDKIIQQIGANTIKKIRNKQANTYVGIGSHGQISKSTKGQSLQPLKVLEIPGKGGTITADENKVDEIARNAWKNIFDGNIYDQDALIKNFFNKYRDYIYKGDAFPIEDLDWKNVKAACSNVESAGSLDTWTKKELNMLSDEASKWITKWLQSIENEGAWPEDQRQARAIFLCKDPKKAQDPMSYRIIKITSTFYRIYGSVRSRS